MPGAVPQGLVSREMMSMIDGVKTTRNTLLPTSGVGPWTALGNNKIIFSVRAVL